jgi:hypothetical protein
MTIIFLGKLKCGDNTIYVLTKDTMITRLSNFKDKGTGFVTRIKTMQIMMCNSKSFR